MYCHCNCVLYKKCAASKPNALKSWSMSLIWKANIEKKLWISRTFSIIKKFQKTPEFYEIHAVWDQTMSVNYVYCFDVHCDFNLFAIITSCNKTYQQVSVKRDFTFSCFSDDGFGSLLKKLCNSWYRALGQLVML